MNAQEYRAEVEKFLVYRNILAEDQWRTYVAMGLMGEVGEVANVIKKMMKGEERQYDLFDELGDVLWYAEACLIEAGIVITDRELDRWTPFEEPAVNTMLSMVEFSQRLARFVADSQPVQRDYEAKWRYGAVCACALRIANTHLIEATTLSDIREHNIRKLRARHG